MEKIKVANKYQKSIDLLNDALGKEIATSLQYMYFHVHFEDAGYEYLSKKMRMISIAEMRHSEELSDRILFLQGDVNMNPSFTTRQISDPKEMFRFAIQLEQSTIDSYNDAARIAAEADDSVTHKMFQDLAVEEEEHLDYFRNELQNLLDYGDKEYRIHKVLPRTNRLLRPAIANVDQALIVTSLKDPDYSCHLLNRLIFLVGLAGVKPVICVTKLDLLDCPEEILADLEKYKKAGYDVVFSNPGSDDKELQDILNGKVSVLCGQSGAGKSSLLNRLNPDFELQTQAISKALGRGKHTTRYCQLHHVCDGLVADTPGFSSLDFTRLDTSHLDECILDFKPYIHTCRFKDCKHLNEPDCKIKEAVENGDINPSIYEDYKNIMEERGKKQ